MADQEGQGKTPAKKQAAAPAPATEAPKAETEKAAPADPRFPLGHAPELGPKGKALVTAAKRANGGEFPTAEYPVKEAFGQTYPAGTWTNHKVEWVQKLVWDLRQLRTVDGGVESPSYRTIAEALGIQCSAITEAVTHSYGRKAKADDAWKVNTGGRVEYLRKQAETPKAPAKGA